MLSSGVLSRPPALPPALPPGCRVYAVGDIHGRLDLLERLLGLIAQDAEGASRALTLLFLGDYIDRGPSSRGVIERLMAGPPADGPLREASWICLRGNHEQAMLEFVEGANSGKAWCINGGVATVVSYLGEDAHRYTNNRLWLRKEFAQALPPKHLRFLVRLPLSYTLGDYFFVHAGVRPGVALAEQDTSDLLWIRDDFLFWDGEILEKVIVHGHSQCLKPEVRSYRIGIDTGAYRTDRLTALVLEGTDKRFLTS